jgi:AcrR family transcriptional regulator
METEDPQDISLPHVAEDVGISTRTLYRYFATREELFAAAGEHVVARLGLRITIDAPEDISADFLRSAAAGAEHPQLIRSLLYSNLGRRARSAHRGRRPTRSRALPGPSTPSSPSCGARHHPRSCWRA